MSSLHASCVRLPQVLVAVKTWTTLSSVTAGVWPHSEIFVLPVQLAT